MNKTKLMLFGLFAATVFTGCVNDDEDTSLPDYTPVLFGEDFETDAVDNAVLAIQGWTNYAEAGDDLWKFQYFGQNNYAEFTSFQSQDAVNIAWLITPKINLDQYETEKLLFQVSQSFVSNPANTLQVLISSDYDGTNPTTATWQTLPANIPGSSAAYFEFQSGGDIDLSEFEGDVNIAFKVTGSGTNQQLDGSYQIDNVRIIY
ncbi:MAG TPA: choice-of-anchor J domain-containing protein [Flavobacterium sp.]